MKTTLVGLVTLGPLIALGFLISSKAPNALGKILGLGLVFLVLLVALLGSAGLALRVGEGLKAVRDEAEPWRRVLRGGTVLGLTFVLPFIGWVVVIPLSFIAGFGAMVLSRSRQSTVSQPATIPATDAQLSSSAL